jgi:hypothetical protein
LWTIERNTRHNTSSSAKLEFQRYVGSAYSHKNGLQLTNLSLLLIKRVSTSVKDRASTRPFSSITMKIVPGTLLVLTAVLSATPSDALVPNSHTENSLNRRGAFGLIGAGAVSAFFVGKGDVAHATAAKTGASSPFTGDYNDPNHPECLRQVKVVGAPLRADGSRSAYPVIEVTGYDGKGQGPICTDRPTRADLWKVQGTVKSTKTALIDFSPKGGPPNLLATYEDGAIVFPDGNRWTKVPQGTNDRRPADMSTLKSD